MRREVSVSLSENEGWTRIEEPHIRKLIWGYSHRPVIMRKGHSWKVSGPEAGSMGHVENTLADIKSNQTRKGRIYLGKWRMPV